MSSEFEVHSSSVLHTCSCLTGNRGFDAVRCGLGPVADFAIDKHSEEQAQQQ